MIAGEHPITDEEVATEEVATAILAGLPEEYDTMVTILTATDAIQTPASGVQAQQSQPGELVFLLHQATTDF